MFGCDLWTRRSGRRTEECNVLMGFEDESEMNVDDMGMKLKGIWRGFLATFLLSTPDDWDEHFMTFSTDK